MRRATSLSSSRSTPTVRDAAAAAPGAWALLCTTVREMPATDHLDAHALVRSWEARDTA